MDDDRAAAYAASAAVWSRLATLLPDPDDVELVQDCWDIGEQEAGLSTLVERLTELRLPVDDTARTRGERSGADCRISPRPTSSSLTTVPSPRWSSTRGGTRRHGRPWMR
ncbi:hypothetical protein PV755_32880 [Streptomyces caniscabiei]|uniref:Uncharacterized protein n=1 Tax=Streptomyces caniscabiei TaxID=2746961 RepID=A0A927LA84_9ACTN|nr:hypothetical protein [Streptomyces caniscabiei]MBD9726954.1 hypothetical protein [Streptomyces caniscabiei]MDX3513643.1 hypothetical protein [Streptomyces caniscabiei]MDX3722666.1 hypothetical protein [Streptomyces caniscabiei]WEO23372.1 hypothetical protein IHE65_09470 [Streptomyces caniscabiei]